MTRKKLMTVLLAVCTMALLLVSCGSGSSLGLGVDKNVYVGMTQEELVEALGEPSVKYEEEEGIFLAGYDARTLYDLTFRVDFYFDDTGLFKAIYTTDYVEMERAQEVFNKAHADVVEALSTKDGYYEEDMQGVFGQDERVSVYMGYPIDRTEDETDEERFIACVSYEYGMMTFTFMPEAIDVG